jgi:hypothetical protein
MQNVTNKLVLCEYGLRMEYQNGIMIPELSAMSVHVYFVFPWVLHIPIFFKITIEKGQIEELDPMFSG